MGYEYQWLSSSDGSQWSVIGAGASSWPIANLSSDTYYKCRVTDNQCLELDTESIWVNILDPIQSPQITLANGSDVDYQCIGENPLEINTVIFPTGAQAGDSVGLAQDGSGFTVAWMSREWNNSNWGPWDYISLNGDDWTYENTGFVTND